jgi:hypothetical protein
MVFAEFDACNRDMSVGGDFVTDARVSPDVVRGRQAS